MQRPVQTLPQFANTHNTITLKLCVNVEKGCCCVAAGRNLQRLTGCVISARRATCAPSEKDYDLGTG